jgi:hypothetical protein
MALEECDIGAMTRDLFAYYQRCITEGRSDISVSFVAT